MIPDLKTSIAEIESHINDPTNGLPDDVFYFIGRNTPFINVDLLISSSRGVLLAWRDDIYAGVGWHIPGGIIRFRESIPHRIEAVFKNEVGGDLADTSVAFLGVNEVISSSKERSHFISLLYEVKLSDVQTKYISLKHNMEINNLHFFQEFPADFLEIQNRTYGVFLRKYFSERHYK